MLLSNIIAFILANTPAAIAGLLPVDAISSFLGVYHAKLYGAKGDGATDDTAVIIAILAKINAAGKDATIYFPSGIYIVAGALLDTGGANAQICLPARTTQLSIRFLGSTPPSLEPFHTNIQGSILRSTLASGSGNFIGCKGTLSSPVAGTSDLSVVLEDITIQTVPNPTISAVDFSYIPNYSLRGNVVISTSQALATNPATDFIQPTTATSYGLKGMLNNLGDLGSIDNLLLFGFYTNARFSELLVANNIISVYSNWPVEFTPGFYCNVINRLLVTQAPHGLRFTDLDAPHVSNVIINDFSIEHDTVPSWCANVDDISDPSDLATGFINWHVLVSDVGVSDVLDIDGGNNLRSGLRNSAHPQHSRHPYLEIFASFSANDFAVHEINRHKATSTDSKLAWLSLVNEQSGTSNGIGAISASNAAISGAEKRVAEIAMGTDGAINSGHIQFITFKAGVGAFALVIDKDGNLIAPLIPTADPHIVGALYSTSGTVHISAG